MNLPATRFPGWRIAWALGVTQTVGFGVMFYAFAVFVLPMENELGWTRAQTSGPFSLALLVSGLAAFPVGRIVDRHGGRATLSLGSALGAGMVVAWSFVETLPALYLVQAGIGLAMAASLYDVAFTVLAVWFRRYRIRAMLIVTVLAGFASTIFVPLSTALVEGMGWRTALRVLAVILLGVALPLHGLVVRSRPSHVGLVPDGGGSGADPAAEPSMATRVAVRSPAFRWLAVAFTLDRIAIVAVVAHAVPLLVERGHPPALVAAAVGSIGLMQVVGRLVFAPAAERWSLAPIASVTFALRAAALVGLAALPGGVAIWFFAASFGIANGATTLARAGLVAAAFGPAHFGAINGSLATVVGLAQAASPVAMGAVRQALGAYDVALWVLAAAAALSAWAVWRAGGSLGRTADGRSPAAREARQGGPVKPS